MSKTCAKYGIFVSFGDRQKSSCWLLLFGIRQTFGNRQLCQKYAHLAIAKRSLWPFYLAIAKWDFTHIDIWKMVLEDVQNMSKTSKFSWCLMAKNRMCRWTKKHHAREPQKRVCVMVGFELLRKFIMDHQQFWSIWDHVNWCLWGDIELLWLPLYQIYVIITYYLKSSLYYNMISKAENGRLPTQ